MKLKYKKTILMTTLCTMGIGLLTLSLSQGKPRAQEYVDTTNEISANKAEGDESSLDSTDATDTGDTSNMSSMSTMAKAAVDESAVTAVPIPTSIPTPIPTPTPIPVYPLEEMEGMDTFIEQFYIAKTTVDMDKLKSLHLAPNKVKSRAQWQSLVQYIEEYKNINTYSKKGPEEGSYIVYAYHEIKFSSINTLAPGLSKFYVITDEEGNFKIVSDMSPEVEEYFVARDADADVLDLIVRTNTKSEEAKAMDEDLMIYWNGLDELAASDENQTDQED